MYFAPDQQAEKYHAELPGLVRAALNDSGVADQVVDDHVLGWDGDTITVPVLGADGRTRFLERWDPARIGVAVNKRQFVELFGWEALSGRPGRVFFAEGIHEALVLESHGLDAIAASDTGLFYKVREWTPALRLVSDLVMVFRRGERRDRKKFTPSRSEIIESISVALPNSRQFEWPADVGDQGGAYDYFVGLGRSGQAFRTLLARSL